MKNTISALALLAVMGAGTALAQTTTTTPAPSTTAPAAKTTSPAVTTTDNAGTMQMTDEQARAWISKTVYSSDAKNVGEVAAIMRDSSGKVTELQADVGGFLGIGETRVRVMPSQFKVVNDRIVLNVPSDQVKTLPHVAK